MAYTNVPRGRPLPAFGSARNVRPVMPCENKQARAGGKARDASHVISLT